jgi:hypothetical protein
MDYTCEETGRTFKKGELFYYYYHFEKKVLTGNIGELNYKHDGGLFKIRKRKRKKRL